MTVKSIIYPVFLPHAGCPFQCVYCNQRAITSNPFQTDTTAGIITRFQEQFTRLLEHARAKHAPGEIAFYGGTFTALPSAVIREILETATPWVRAGVFSSFRLSTRPDAITEKTCSLLKDYPVATIELGVQSFADEVLIQSGRGYCVETVERAVSLVQTQGWRLGFQLMLGLPGDSPVRFMDSISETVRLRPNFVRIYPTLVLAGTLLAECCRAGSYLPLSLDEAVSWCVPAYEVLFREGIPIARLGLHPDPELQKPGAILAGPFHPAFGYLVRVHWWRQRLDRYLEAHHGVALWKEMTLRVAERSLSEVIGPGRANVRYWQEKWRLKEIQVEGSADQLPGEFDALPKR